MINDTHVIALGIVSKDELDRIYSLTARANEVLKQLEENHENKVEKHITKKADHGYQLSFIQLDDPLLLDIKNIIVELDINSLTPVEALMKLNEIKEMLVRKKKK